MAITRHTVEYNGFVLPLPVGAFRYEVDIRSNAFIFVQEFMVFASNGGDFASAVMDIERKLTVANARLIVTWDGSTYLDLNPSANTALLTRGRLIKPGVQKTDGQIARHYVLEVSGFVPARKFSADNTTRGFIEGSIAISFDATERRAYVFSGMYTAEPVPVKTSYEMFNDVSLGAESRLREFIDSIEGVGANEDYKFHEAPTVAPDDQNKRLTFRISLVKQIVPDVDSTKPRKWYIDSIVAGRRLVPSIGVVTPTISGNDRSGIHTLPVKFFVNASFKLKHTGVDGALLLESAASLYERELRPYLFNILFGAWKTSAVGDQLATLVFDQEEVTPIVHANVIHVSWVFSNMTNSAGTLIELDYNVRYETDERVIDYKLMDGRAHTYHSQTIGAKEHLILDISGVMLSDVLLNKDKALKFALEPGAPYFLRKTDVQVSNFNIMTVTGSLVFLGKFNIRRVYLRNEATSAAAVVPVQNPVRTGR